MVKKYDHSVRYLINNAREKKERYSAREEEILEKTRDKEPSAKLSFEMPKKFKSLPALDLLPSKSSSSVVLSERGRLKLLDAHLQNNQRSNKEAQKSIFPDTGGVPLDKEKVRFFLYKDYNRRQKDARMNKIGLIKTPHFNRKHVFCDGFQTHALITAYRTLSMDETKKVFGKMQERAVQQESASQSSISIQKTSSFPSTLALASSGTAADHGLSGRNGNFGLSEATLFSKFNFASSKSINVSSFDTPKPQISPKQRRAHNLSYTRNEHAE